jgi:hypothetical protein
MVTFTPRAEPMAKHRLVRRGDYLRDDEWLCAAARSARPLRTDALRNHSIYGFYGLGLCRPRRNVA